LVIVSTTFLIIQFSPNAAAWVAKIPTKSF
jgi:hypothetical protein